MEIGPHRIRRVRSELVESLLTNLTTVSIRATHIFIITWGSLIVLYLWAMGLLYLGTPLPWDEAKKYADHVRTHGITQFLHIWDRLKDRTGDELLWGDEVRWNSFEMANYLSY